MSLSYDIIKIHLSHLGYLPDYPYHLISDSEMFDAFLHEDLGDYYGYFIDTYPCNSSDTQISSAYSGLITSMLQRIQYAKLHKEYILPDWMQSYMLGVVVGPNSDPRDRHDLLVSLDLDNMEEEFTDAVYSSILRISTNLVHRYEEVQVKDVPELQSRNPSIFGELNVIKYLRVLQ